MQLLQLDKKSKAFASSSRLRLRAQMIRIRPRKHPRTLLVPRRQHVHAVVRHDHRVLVLRAPAPVLRHRRPPVRPRRILPIARVYHRLDRKHVAGFHRADGFVLRVVRHVRRAVKQRPDPVPAVALHDARVPPVRDSSDLLADVAIPRPGLHALDRPEEALVRRHQELLRLFVAVPYAHRLVQVAVVAAKVRRDVDVQHVAVLQRPRVRYPVADDLVHARAARLGEVVVVQRRRVASVRGDVRVTNLIELLRRHADARRAHDRVQRPARDDAHGLRGLGVVGLRVIPREATSGRSRKASEAESKGVEGGDCERGVGGDRRRRNSLRNGVHHANGVVRGPV
eukprot:31537-Pelagococcus_subviridis.AAC.6